MLTGQFANWLESLGLEGSRDAVPDIFSPTGIIGLTRGCSPA